MVAARNEWALPGGLTAGGPEGPDTSDFKLEDFFTFRLVALARAMDRRSKPAFARKFGLSLAEWRILAIIALEGEATLNGLANRVGYDKSQVSRAVAALSARGTLRRQASSLDQRSTLISLSDEGRALYEAALSMGREREQRLLAPLSPEQRRELYRSMNVLREHLDEMEEAEETSDAA
jgi:DNA-binding MarR family transcriptional regulator